MAKYHDHKSKIVYGIARTLNAARVPHLKAAFCSMQTGGPSVVIFTPPPRKRDARGAALVVLNERRKLTELQYEWWNIMNGLGFSLAIVYTPEDAQERLERWGYLDTLGAPECPHRSQTARYRLELSDGRA